MATNVTWLPQVPRTSGPKDDEPGVISSLEDEQLPDSTRRYVDLEALPPPANDELEYITFTPDNVEAWIETQLLDCQNLARQHGLTKTASILDTALDQLGQVTDQLHSAGEDAKEPGPGIALVR